MPAWSLSTLLGALCIACHFLLIRAASGRIGDWLGALMVEASAAIGLAIGVLARGRGSDAGATRAGIGFSVAGGLAVAAASVLLFAALRRGAPVASAGTIVLGGGVTIAAAAAPWLFGELMTPRRALGVGLGLVAMWLLGAES